MSQMRVKCFIVKSYDSHIKYLIPGPLCLPINCMYMQCDIFEGGNGGNRSRQQNNKITTKSL